MEKHDHRLTLDLKTLLRAPVDRRQALLRLLADSVAPLAGCGGGAEVSLGSVATISSSTTTGYTAAPTVGIAA